MDIQVTLGAILICLATVLTPLLVARQSFRRQDVVAERLHSSDKEIKGTLDIIHTLVNSNMTSAMQSEYDATMRELAMMLEVIDLKKAAGLAPSVEALAAVEHIQSRIAELGSQLEDRRKSQEIIDTKIGE